MLRLSVVIPAHNAADTIAPAVRALVEQRPHEVVVVDDASTDATATLARQAGATVVRGAGRGPAAARNRGAAATSGDALAFVDADCTADPGWLDAVVAALATADLVQGQVLPPVDAIIGPYDRFIAVTSEYGLYETANLAVRRELFDALGGFESILTPRRGIELGEDVWFGWRARRSGAVTTFASGATVRHVVFPRGPRAYVAERLRLRFFPELARRVPELRDGFLHRRWFLSPRTLRFDAALTGLVLAATLRRGLPLLAAGPYARTAWRQARDSGRRDLPVVLAVQVAADVVGAAALLVGSVRSRTPVA